MSDASCGRPMTERRRVAMMALLLSWLVPMPAGAQMPAKSAENTPENTIACADFTRNGDGTWTAAKETSFRFAGFTVKLKAGAHITPTSHFYDNNRLIDALNAKCGGQ